MLPSPPSLAMSGISDRLVSSARGCSTTGRHTPPWWCPSDCNIGTKFSTVILSSRPSELRKHGSGEYGFQWNSYPSMTHRFPTESACTAQGSSTHSTSSPSSDAGNGTVEVGTTRPAAVSNVGRSSLITLSPDRPSPHKSTPVPVSTTHWSVPNPVADVAAVMLTAAPLPGFSGGAGP